MFPVRPAFAGLLEKLEIGAEAIARGAHADLQLASRPLSPETAAPARARWSRLRASWSASPTGRPLDAPGVDEVGRGRVWLGARRSRAGSSTSSAGCARRWCARRRSWEIDPNVDVSLVPYPPPKPLAEQIGELLGLPGARFLWPSDRSRPGCAPVERWLEIAAQREIQAVLPFSIEIR